MPFTFAHPAYAAPLKLLFPRRISLTGLIMGSMAPDFEYFIALEPHRTIGHSTLGLFAQALPLSFLLAWMFHYFMKDGLAVHSPSLFGLDARLAALSARYPWKLSGLSSCFVFAISVVIGFYSHVLLDSFTHQSGYFVQRIGFLERGAAFGVPVYKLLQHGLSLAGLLGQAAALLILLGRTEPSPAYTPASAGSKARFWGGAAAAALLIVTVKLAWFSGGNMIGTVVVSSISGMFAGVAVSSAIYKLRIKAKKDR